MNVSKRINLFRTKKKLTVNKLANMAGVSQSFLREIEIGNKKPTVETVSLLCDALGITLSDFFREDTPSALLDNELLQQIYLLNPKQQATLLSFLKSL